MKRHQMTNMLWNTLSEQLYWNSVRFIENDNLWYNIEKKTMVRLQSDVRGHVYDSIKEQVG